MNYKISLAIFWGHGAVESLMSDRKSMVFAHSTIILGGESDGLGAQTGVVVMMFGLSLGIGTHNVPL